MDRKSVEDLKSSLSWISLVKRDPIENQISVSRGVWQEEKFTLLPLTPVSWDQACWRKLFCHGIVATFETSIPDAPLLRAPMHVLYFLTGVNYAIQVDKGLILHGVFSALVPVMRLADGSIRWHVEIDPSRNDFLYVSQMESLRRPWFRTLDLELLKSAPAVVGWSPEASLMLGTSFPPDSTWSPPHGSTRTWQVSQFNLQLAVQIPQHLSLTGSAVISRLENRTRLDTPTNYIQVLHKSRLKPIILYDVEAKRAWLVPLVSLLHYMTFAYSVFIGNHQVPQAEVSLGGESSLNVLMNNGGQVLSASDTTSLTIQGLILGYVANLCKITPKAIRGGRLIGHQLMDLIHGAESTRSETISLRPRPNWTPLLKEIPCLLGAGFGDIITSSRAAESTSCNNLLVNQNFLASTVDTINKISLQRGQRDLSNSRIRHLPGGVWASEGAFGNCQHTTQSTVDCWQDASFLQSIKRKAKDGMQTIPERGAVVFGGEGNNRFKDFIKRLM